MLNHRAPSAPGPTWLWVAVFAGTVAALGYVRLAVFPGEFVPLAYGLPLLLCLWRRDLRLLWGATIAFLLILLSKLATLLSTNPQLLGRHLLFGGMQIVSLLSVAVAVHLVIVLSRRLELTISQLEESNTELEVANEELVAREEEIGQQNEELQSQTAELEQQAEELSGQAEELQALNDQLIAGERTLGDLISLSATGANEQQILNNLGEMVARMLGTRVCAAAIQREGGSGPALTPLFGLDGSTPEIPASVMEVVAAKNRAAYIADLALRPDIPLPELEGGKTPQSLLLSPARLDGHGTLLLLGYSDRTGDWTSLELHLAEWCADQCARWWTTARLRDDLARLAESERAARAQAERALREKDEFVATLAHELRTPVGAILGWANLLRTMTTRPEEREQGLEVIERNARQQVRLISDLFDVARAASGRLHLELQPVELAGVVAEAVADVKPMADAKAITLEQDLDGTDIVVHGDPVRLQQVVWNVLTNAVKFTPDEGTVRISVSAANNAAQVVVGDNGQGIEPALIPQLFERYRQADSSTSRLHRGLGLGLSIVKHLVDLHKGEVRLESAGQGLGTTCTITLPLAPPHVRKQEGASPAPANTIAADDHSLSGFRILLVDDDADTLALVARMLRDHGATVTTARSGQDALAQLEHTLPHVLITDIGMPGLDGYELLRRIRHNGHPERREIPAIALTAFARPEDRDRARESGFQLQLDKPIDAGRLASAVANLRRGVSPPSPSGGARSASTPG